VGTAAPPVTAGVGGSNNGKLNTVGGGSDDHDQTADELNCPDVEDPSDCATIAIPSACGTIFAGSINVTTYCPRLCNNCASSTDSSADGEKANNGGGVVGGTLATIAILAAIVAAIIWYQRKQSQNGGGPNIELGKANRARATVTAFENPVFNNGELGPDEIVDYLSTLQDNRGAIGNDTYDTTGLDERGAIGNATYDTTGQDDHSAIGNATYDTIGAGVPAGGGQNNFYDAGVRSSSKPSEDFGGFGDEYETIAPAAPANNMYDVAV